jgi:predicted transcriptional regulator of viral defense system
MHNRATFERLYVIAEQQHGCFTAQQACTAGYSAQSQYYHVQCGDWERLFRGIFRLRFFPRPERLDLMIYYLWASDGNAGPQGIFSHDTALSLYPYSVWIPNEKHITVPPSFRRRAQTPGKVRFYKGLLDPKDVCTVQGVRVTKPLRTLADLMVRGFVAQYHLVDFIRTSLAAGVITDTDLNEPTLSEHEWNLIEPLFQNAGYNAKETWVPAASF